eukprot:scaffold68660_cov54-Phaeocystis_antarctica.AAC.2
MLPRFRRAGVRLRRGAGLGAAPWGRPRHRNQPAANVRRALPPAPARLRATRSPVLTPQPVLAACSLPGRRPSSSSRATRRRPRGCLARARETSAT